jgi:hypothetical protein
VLSSGVPQGVGLDSKTKSGEKFVDAMLLSDVASLVLRVCWAIGIKSMG